MDRLIIVVDLGHFKAFKVSQNVMESPKVELIESYDNIEAHGRLGDKISDKAGRFGMGGDKKSLKGYGEPHNIELETEKRLVKRIAADIKALLTREMCDKWYLAASKSINSRIVDQLDPKIKAKLAGNLTTDLTKTKKSEILGYFER